MIADKYTTSWCAAVVMSILLFLVMLLYPHSPYDDQMTAIGDTVDYQTIAVNFAQRHVFPVTGLLLPGTVYRFRIADHYPGAWTAAEIETAAPTQTFYRNPLYPLFCGVVYKAWGVKPSILFRIQFFILALSLSLLPLIGRSIAGWRGIVTGAVCSVLIFILMRQYACEVQTQALLLPYTIGLWWVLTRYIHQRDIRSTLIIGIYLGVGLLLKNFYTPIAILVCSYRIWRFKDMKTLMLPLVIVFTILPYTIYVNHLRDASQPLIMITDQGGDVLLDANNDLATDGDWHSGGAAATAYYQQPGIRSQSALRQVISYATHHPLATVLSLSAKIRLGLLSRWPPVLFLLVLTAAYFISLARGKVRAVILASAALFLISMIAFYILQRSAFYEVQAILSGVLHHSSIPLLLLPLCYLMLRKVGQKYLFKVHAGSWILVIGFVSLTLIFYGSNRIVGMIDFIWLFYALLIATDLTAQTSG